MAAIDKLYLHEYSEYDELRTWTIIYYPKLLRWFYNAFWSYSEYENGKNDWIEHCKKLCNYDYDYSFPVMNTPFKVDRKLKWICPLPFVREYLHKQCGVNPKWEWLYRIFWRGKKEFI